MKFQIEYQNGISQQDYKAIGIITSTMYLDLARTLENALSVMRAREIDLDDLGYNCGHGASHIWIARKDDKKRIAIITE